MTAQLEQPVTTADAHMLASRRAHNWRLTTDWPSALVREVKVHRLGLSPSFQHAASSLPFPMSGFCTLWDVTYRSVCRVLNHCLVWTLCWTHVYFHLNFCRWLTRETHLS